MPIILESWKDIAGGDYADFLDMALDWFGFLSLVWRDTSSFDDSAIQIRRDLERHVWREEPRRRSVPCSLVVTLVVLLREKLKRRGKGDLSRG